MSSARRTPHFLADVLESAGAYGLTVETSGLWLARTLEAAVDSETRKRGLLGRDALDPDSAIVIAPCQGVHTFGMRFDIDIVGVERDGRVAKIRRAVPPRRLVFALRAFAILEMAGGACTRVGLKVGDRLVLTASSTV